MKNPKNKFAYILFLLSPYRKHKVWVITQLIISCMINIYANLGSLYFTSILLGMLESRTKTLFEMAVVIVLILAAFSTFDIVTEAVYVYYLVPNMKRIQAKINNDVFEQLKKTDYKYFDDPEFFDKFTVTYGNFADKATDALNTVIGIVSDIVTIIALIGYIAVQNWIVIAIAVLSMIFNVIINTKRNKYAIEREDRTSRYNREKKYYYDRLISRDSAMDIKATYLKELFEEKYNKATEENIKINKLLDIKGNILTLYSSLVTQGSFAIVRLTTCVLVLAGKVGISSMVVLISACSELTYKMELISDYAQDIHKLIIDGERICTFLELSSSIEQNPTPAKELVSNEPFAYELRNVSFAYPNSGFALKGINMKFRAGSKIAIVGENGGGKTTLTKLLLRLYDPQEGEILLNGHPLAEYDINSVRERIGIAFQESPIYSMTMRENLSVYTQVTDEIIDQISEDFPVENILRKNNATYDTEITRLFDDNGIMLSGGERQKLSVARVMTKKFGMLVFDEPTAALDPIAEEQLSQSILSASNKTTTILISHRLSNVVNADCIYVIRNGQIVEYGTHRELIAQNGYYAEMFTMQAKNYQEDSKVN